MATERLQKIISRAGVASRRKAEQLIVEGRVTVNGAVAVLGMRADPSKDHIKVNGKLLRATVTPRHYFLANKPRNMITSLSDPEGRPTVTDILRRSKIRVRVFPVGRLDWDADGLLLLTNDGELANRIMHPRTHVPKVYRVKVQGHLRERTLRRLRHGVKLGRMRTLPAKVRVERQSETCSWVLVTLIEGRHHQIKEMFDRVGHPVLRIKRIAMGPLRLGTLRLGDVRQLTTREIKLLRKAVNVPDTG